VAPQVYSDLLFELSAQAVIPFRLQLSVSLSRNPWDGAASSVIAPAAHFRTLAEGELIPLAAIRRDATIEPKPTTVDQLAERLHTSSMAAACARLTLPQAHVAEAAVALFGGCGGAAAPASRRTGG
jgi:hypothetical protein